MNSVSPYILHLSIIRGENLPVGDITTSDPYVKILLDNKEIGTTKVVKRSLSPRWDYNLIENIQSIHESVLLLRVMDEDIHSEDDMLGVITIKISNITVNTDIDYKLPLEQCGNQIKARGYVYLQIKLIKNDNEIKVTRNTTDTIGLLPWNYDNTLSNVLIDSKEIASDDSPIVNVLDAYSFVLKDIPNIHDILSDFMFDIKLLNDYDIDIIDDIINKSVIRRSRQATKTSVKPIHSNYSPHNLPIYNQGIKLNYVDREVAIELNNKYSTWNLIRWIDIAMKYWMKTVDKNDLPIWLTSDYRSNVNITFKQSDQNNITTWQGTIYIMLSKPFVISLYDTISKTLHSTLDLALLLSITLSNDSFIPTNVSLLLEIGIIRDETNRSNIDNDDKFGPKGHIGFRRFVRKSAYQLSSVATVAAKNIVHTAVEATRVITTGEAVQVLVSAPNLVIEAGKDLVTYVSTTTGGFIFHGDYNQELCYIIMKFNNNSYISMLSKSHENSIDNQIIVDIDSFDLQTCLDLIKNKSALLYEKTIDIYLYKGLVGNEKLVGQTFIHLSDLLDNQVMNYSYSNLNNYPVIENVLKFNSDIGYSITLLNGKGLRTPSLSLPGGGMYVTCRLVDSNGKAINSDCKHSNRVLPSHNPDWKSETIFITAHDQVNKSHYVRLKIAGGVNFNPETLGYVLIPVHEFYEKEIEKELHITSFKPLGGNPGNGGSYGNGTITLRLQKIYEDKSSINENNRLPNINVQSKLINHSIYHSFYPCDILLCNNTLDVNTFVEYYYLSICSSDHLLLIEHDSISCINDTDDTSNVTKLATVSKDNSDDNIIDGSHRNSISSISNDSNNSNIFISIYENQRRSIFPPYEWGDNNLFKLERSQYTDESGSQSYKSIHLIKPPSGYEWIHNWELDKNYILCDNDGWTYGVHFNDIVKNYKYKVKSISPSLMSVRTRKWIRKAKYIHHNVSNNTINKSDNLVDNETAMQSDSKPNTPKMKRNSMSQTNIDWRMQDFNSDTKSIMKYCKEKNYSSIYLSISWDKVFNPVVITESILSLNIKVNRYFGLDQSNQPIFREVIMDVYLTNCLSNQLLNIINERILFFIHRLPVKQLLSNNSIYQSNENSLDKANGISIDSNIDNQLDKENNEAPVTVELSHGSMIVSTIEVDIITIDKIINDLYKSYYIDSPIMKESKHEDRRLERENHVRLDNYLYSTNDIQLYCLRSCRLRLYIATILSNNLQSNQSYDINLINKEIEKDINTMLSINLSDDVITMSNRIQYLLDIAENRIRDIWLCGWTHRSELANYLSIYINKYLFIIIENLSIYFKEINSIRNIKGLQNKLVLISIITKYNDTLVYLLEQLLFYYKYVNQPKPHLTVYLNFNNLLNWYTIIIQNDMNEIVSNAVNTYKTNRSNIKYKSNIPWHPIREGINNNGRFITYLPEDIILYLNTYIEYATLNSNDISKSLVNQIEKVDFRIKLCYVLTYYKLINEYYTIITSTKWNQIHFNKLNIFYKKIIETSSHTNKSTFSNLTSKSMTNILYEDILQLSTSEQEVIDETIEYLCSVANDTNRIIDNKLFDRSTNNHDNSNNNIEKDLNNQIQSNYELLCKTNYLSIENLSNILLYDILTVDNYLHSDYILTYIDECLSKVNFFDTTSYVIFKRFDSLLNQLASYLSAYNIYILISICINKFIIRYYYLLKDLLIVDKEILSNIDSYMLIVNSLINDAKYLITLVGNINNKLNNQLSSYINKISDNIDSCIDILSLLSIELSIESIDSIVQSIDNYLKNKSKETFAYIYLFDTVINIRMNLDDKIDSNKYTSTYLVLKRNFDISNPYIISYLSSLKEKSDIKYSRNELIDQITNQPNQLNNVIKIFYLSNIIVDKRANIFTIYKFILDSVFTDNELTKVNKYFESTKDNKRGSKVDSSINSNIDNQRDSETTCNKSSRRSSILDVFRSSTTNPLNEITNPSISLNKYMIIISNIKVINLFIVDIYRQPTTYVKISITNQPIVSTTYKTSTIHNSLNPNWINENPCTFYLNNEQSNLSIRDVRFDVMYVNRLVGEELLGSCRLNLLTIDENIIHSIELDIDCKQSSNRIIECYNKSISNNQSKPMIKFNITLQSINQT